MTDWAVQSVFFMPKYCPREMSNSLKKGVIGEGQETAQENVKTAH